MTETMRLPNLHIYADRHGKARARVRRKGQKGINLTAAIGTAEFMEQYQSAMDGLAPARAPAAKRRPLPPVHTPVVYFVKVGERVKIGYTTNLRDRVRAFQTAAADRVMVLLTIPGDLTLERLLHERFAHCRIQGEWFNPAPDLTYFIHQERTNRRRQMANSKLEMANRLLTH